MRSIVSLIQRLKSDYPQFTFVESDEYLWSPANQTVYYKNNDNAPEYILHELSHGLLGHVDYDGDVMLLAIERAAWEHARLIAPAYKYLITDEIIEENLDTYRDWLHARSTCPSCTAIGIQISPHGYNCLACGHSWRVNEARICGLRRTTL